MENNCILVSAYVLSNGKVFRNYYVDFGGYVCQVKLDTTLDFIKDSFKRCACYDYEDLKKYIKSEITLESLNTITYQEFKKRYGVK